MNSFFWCAWAISPGPQIAELNPAFAKCPASAAKETVFILNDIKDITSELQPHQVHSFYRSCGIILSAESDDNKLNDLIKLLFNKQSFLRELIPK